MLTSTWNYCHRLSYNNIQSEGQVPLIVSDLCYSPCVSLCLPLADSGIGSTVYSDSHSSGLHNVIYQSIQDSVSTTAQEVRITYPSWLLMINCWYVELAFLYLHVPMHACTCIAFIQRNYTKYRPSFIMTLLCSFVTGKCWSSTSMFAYKHSLHGELYIQASLTISPSVKMFVVSLIWLLAQC